MEELSALEQLELIMKEDKETANADKIRGLAEIIVNTHILHETNIEPKSNEKALSLRLLGNKYFHEDKAKALKHYNKSLCYAEHKSDNLGIAYSNRSAVYFHWKHYNECMENIKLARDHNCPLYLRDKLYNRENECKKYINPHNQPKKQFPKLSYNVHPKIPFIIESLELQKNEYGRGIKTTIDLRPGSLIALEDPFCTIRLPLFNYQRCTYCLKENVYSLIPCEKCTTAMFCNKTCYINALDAFHRLECGLFDNSKFTLFSPDQLGGLRIVLTLYSYPEILPQLKTFVDNADESNINAFTIDYSKNDLITKYKAIHTLSTNEKNRKSSDIFKNIQVAALMYIAIIKNPRMKTIFDSNEEYETLFLDLLYRHLQTSPTNMFSMSTAIKDKIEHYHHGAGIYALCSLFNHNCNANCERITIGNKKAVYALKPIKKDEQLFLNYGSNIKDPVDLRREELRKFCFTCMCENCKYDKKDVLAPSEFVPMPIPIPMPSSVQLLKITADRKSRHEQIFNKNNINKYCRFLKKYDAYFPCAQLNLVQSLLIICLENTFSSLNYTTDFELELEV